MILLVGEVIVDVSFSNDTTKLRLGGVLHACRTLWAMGVDYSLAFVAPEYLSAEVINYASKHGASQVTKIGNVLGSPNVILIKDLQETTSLGYELLLRDQYQCHWLDKGLNWLSQVEAKDAIVFPGQFDLKQVLKAISKTSMQVHIDWANAICDLDDLLSLDRPITTLFDSTSSSHFLDACQEDPNTLCNLIFASSVNSVILKENRGGARFFSTTGESLEVGAQLREVSHSVGVGDCFDSAYIALLSRFGCRAALCYASWIAAEYAVTSFPDDFRAGVKRCLKIPADEITEIPGVRLGWHERPDIHIYIAAPDFDYLDTRTLDVIFSSLKYHNFTPHRPVKEIGQANGGTTIRDRKLLCRQDVELLERCQLIVAVIEIDDPGTAVELGLGAGLGKPVLLFDPKNRATNPMLLGIPVAICHNVDELLVNVFTLFGRKVSIS